MAKIQCSIFSKNHNSYVIIKFMDGHDNDANKNAQNNSASRQGIFSTPELTVNSENITQQNNEETKSRVASIFANTDAGKQAQKLNDAMDAQTVPATEDLVIQNEPKKKSKLPIILLILVLVAAGVGGLVWVLMNNIRVEPVMTARRAFSEYREYLVAGPEGGRGDNQSAGDWFLFTLSESDLSSTEQMEYLNDLESRFATFKTAYDKSSQSSLDSGLDQQINYYTILLQTIINMDSLDFLAQRVLDKYINDGSEAANNYAKSLTAANADDLLVRNANSFISRYLEAELSAIEIYLRHDCIVDEKVDYACGVELSNNNDTLVSAQNNQGNSISGLKQLSPRLYSSLRNSTEIITNLLGDN